MSLIDVPPDVQEQFRLQCTREKAQQEGAADEVMGLLLEALYVAHDNNWHWGAGDPVENVRDALEQLIKEFYPRDRSSRPAYRKHRISPALRKQVMERDAYRCRICLTWKDLSVDHVYPEKLGGPTELGNLQALCKPCNSRKGARVQ